MIESRPIVARRAFSLIELLVVIVIIALVITIAIPALSGARNASRGAGTRSLLSNITQAAAQFERDERRAPGHFAARDMGHPDNGTRGFAAMQNIMLDLAGGIVSTNGCGPGPQDALRIGPANDCSKQVWVNLAYIGVEQSGSKMYWVPDRKFFVAQNEGNQQFGDAEHRNLPSVIDHFANPVLAWAIDDSMVGNITRWEDFGALDSNVSNRRPRFYWNSNAAFLKATGLGRKVYNQTRENLATGSVIGGDTGGSQPPADAMGRSLTGILGHPSFPYRPNPNAVPVAPAAPRGSLVLHTTGPDGIYLSRADRGARQFPVPQRGTALGTFFIDYQINFVTRAGGTLPQDGYADKDGRPTNIDILDRFDDIIVVGGN